MKKTLSVLISIIFVFLIATISVPVAFAASYSGSCGSLASWSLNTFTGELTISGSGKMADYSATSLPDWNQYQSYIKSVSIENGISKVGDYVFYNANGYKYQKLTTVAFGDTVSEIGSYSFRGCHAITTLSGASALTSIGEYAFRSCTGLQSLSLPTTVKTIGVGAFSLCSSVENVTLPSSLLKISASAFSGCESLASITIPQNVTELGNRAFADCTSLENVEYLAKNISAQSGGVFNGSGAPSGMSASIGNSVTALPEGLFAYCKNLKNITIGSSITSIGDDTFCLTGLVNFHVTKAINSISATAFRGCDDLMSFSVDLANSSFSTGSLGELMNKNGTKIIKYPSGRLDTSYTTAAGVTSIAGSAFRESQNLTSITLSSAVTSCETYAFASCKKLVSVELGSGLRALATGLFMECKNLSSIDISLITTIGSYAFSECEKLINLNTSANLTTIGSYAFMNCSGLTTAAFASGLTKISDYAFYNCQNLVSVALPNSLQTISPYAFSYCSSLRSVDLGKGVVSIGTYSFLNCLALTEITIPSSASAIGDYAFGYKISGNSYVAIAGFKIYCYTGTGGHTYASSNTALSHEVITADGIDDEIIIEEPNENSPQSILDKLKQIIGELDLLLFIKQIMSFIFNLFKGISV